MRGATIVLSSGEGYGCVGVALRRGRRWKHPVDGFLTIGPLTNTVLEGLDLAGAVLPKIGIDFAVWYEGDFDRRSVRSLAARLVRGAIENGLMKPRRRR